MLDIVIKNGTIIDGSGAARYRADLGIAGDRIQQIGDLAGAEARETIEANGNVVAAGFIDVHNHSDGWLLSQPNFLSKTSQGFTSEVIMADGISYAPVNPHTARDWLYYLRALNGLRFEAYEGWSSLADYMALLDGRSAQNVITHIPYANVRTMACGFGRQRPDDYQMSLMIAQVERGMAEGAVGLSTGLDYITQCFATTAELAEVCRAMAPQQGLYVTHVRYRKGTLAGVKEAVEIGRRAGVPVHISHLKGRTAQEAEEIITYIDTVATQEVDFSFDVYPYIPSSTMLNYLLPHEVWEDGPLGVIPKLNDPLIRARVAAGLPDATLDTAFIAWLPGQDNRRYLGQTLRAYVEAVGRPVADAICDLLIEENLAVLLVFNSGDDDELVAPFLAHPRFVLGSDGIYHPDGQIHPRQYGSATRLLGRFVREMQCFSLEEGVRKMSGYPAERFGLKDRGLLREGCCADIVVFDPDTVADRATYVNPHHYSVGIEHVIVNGRPIIRAGQPVEPLPEPLPGRALRFKE